MEDNLKSNDTKNRLLEKAETLFAQRGYEGVSVREITAAARCNMGAVNYHFGGKKNLYLEVFRSRWIPRELSLYNQLKQYIHELETPTPAAIIRAVGQAYLEGPLSEDEFKQHRQLIIREINNPTEAFELAADHTLRPLFKYLEENLKIFFPDNLDDERLTLDIMSVFGILLYFNYSRPMISRITGRGYDRDFKTHLIQQLVRFSLEGLSVNGQQSKMKAPAGRASMENRR